MKCFKSFMVALILTISTTFLWPAVSGDSITFRYSENSSDSIESQKEISMTTREGTRLAVNSGTATVK